MKRLSIFLIFNLIFSTLVFVHAESINTSEISEPVSEETATNPDFVAPSSEQTVQSEQDITATEPVSEEISPIQQSGGNTEEIAPAVDTGGLSVNSGTDGSSDVTSDAGAELSNENQVTEQPSNEQEIPILPKSDDMANENLTVSAQSIFEGNIPVFTNPLSFTEDFSVPKNPLVPTVGDSAPYSQFASVKYWGGNDASSLSANNGIIMPDSQESYSVSTLQPVTGNHIFNFNITHPTYNNLNSGIYIGMRTSSQFVNFDGASYTDLPSDGIWLGISYNFVGIGTDLVDGTNSKRFTMNDDFVNYSHFMVCDDVDSGIISYYYINDATNEATLFARIDITENAETSTTSLTYSINTNSGLSTYTVTVNGLISNGKSDTYPQLFVNKYKCDLHSFGITCEGNENAVLNGISVNGAEVSPEISLDNTAYTVKTPRSGTVTVNVTGEAGAKYSVYIDDTEIKMLYGDNILPVKVGEYLYIISDNGVTSTTYSFEMIANTHTVKLVPTYCTITNAESDGTKTITVSDGSPVSFNVTPVAGYDFDHVSTGASYTNGVVSVADVSSDMIIDVVFVRRVPVSLTVGSATAAQGQTILVPISISENSGATAGAFNINYDPNKLEFISGVRTGCIALGSTGLDAVPGDNTKLGFYFISKNLGMTPITVGGVLLYLQFTVKDTAADGETSVTVTIESSATKHGGIDDLDGERLVNITNGTINLYTPLDGKYIIKTIAAPTGSGTVSAGSRYAQGEQVTITATPATGYSFVYWEATNGTISNTSSSSATYTVGNSNAVITAHFSIKTYAINVSVSGDEGGTITPTAYVVNYGEGVSVTLNPYPGYTVSAFTVGGKDKLSSLVNNVYTLTGIKSTQSMVVTYSWTGLDIISGITALRAYDAQYSNSSRTITIKAKNVNSTAGFALDLEGSYFAETGKNLSSETKDGKIYIVVPIAAGENQTFKLYINYGNCPYVYTVFFSFTDDPDLAITDIVSYNGYSVDLDPINYTVNLTVDRWLKENVGFKFILPQGVSASYELIYSLDGGTEMSEISTSDYIDTKGASGAYGAQTLFVVPRSNGLIQQIKVTLSDGNITNEYILKISFNDCSFAGDIRPTTLVPLRLTYYKMDTKNKTIYAEASKSSVTSGFSFTVDGNPPKRYSAESGCNLVVGVKDGYKYIINRRVFGTKQTYKVKIYGNDCYEYSWYTVTIKYV